MKINKNSLFFVSFVASGTALLVGNAMAEISMSERENVQTIVRLVEFVTFFTVIAIAWYVWRISKREIKKKKSKKIKS